MSLPPANGIPARPVRNTRAAFGFFVVVAAILLIGWWAFIRVEPAAKEVAVSPQSPRVSASAPASPEAKSETASPPSSARVSPP